MAFVVVFCPGTLGGGLASAGEARAGLVGGWVFFPPLSLPPFFFFFFRFPPSASSPESDSGLSLRLELPPCCGNKQKDTSGQS